MFSNYFDKYVVTQMIIFFAIILSVPFMHIKISMFIEIIAIMLICGGISVVLISLEQLGSALTPVVTPKENSHLVTSGIYSKVRHPIYSGVTMLAIGWSLIWGSILSLMFSITLIIFFVFKMKKEEILLSKKYPEYDAYKAKVNKKIIPFIY